MRPTRTIAATTAALALSAGLTSLPATAAPAPSVTAGAVREYEGTVLSIDRATRTFRLRDAERGTVRVWVSRTTRFERIAGSASLRTGMTRIETTVRRVNGIWRAVEVERSGGGGRHGGDD